MTYAACAPLPKLGHGSKLKLKTGENAPDRGGIVPVRQ
jgi:hypothetical protein